MDRQRILHELVKREMSRYKSLYSKMKFADKRLPKGSLSERDGRLIYRLRDREKEYAITVYENDSIVSELKHRRYIRECVPLLQKKIRTCEQFLKNDLIYDPLMIESELKSCYHGITDLGIFLEGDMTVEMLDEHEFQKNPTPYKEIHYTADGVMCRSKSEALWGTRLEQRGFTYWYDTALRLYDGSVIYTDFKIYLPHCRRLVMTEHFGMIDNTVYAENSMKRLEKYSKSGYYLGLNLFYTYETREKPLNMKDIDRKLDEIEALDRRLEW